MKQHILENGESNGENATLGIQDLGDSISGYGVIKDDIEKIMGNNKDDFKFYSNDLLQKLGVEGTKQGFFVNIKQRKVISEKGLKYKNKMYYTLDELPDGFYNVEYEDKNTESPQIGNIETMSLDANSWKFIVSDIKYGGYVNKGQVFYKKDGAENWEKTENDYFVVSEPGKYDVKVVDVAGNESETKKAYAYAKNGLILYYDGINNTKKGHDANTTTWEDLSGNNNDGTLMGFDNTNMTCWNDDSLEFNKVTWGEYVVIDNITSLPEEYAVQIVLSHSGTVQDTDYKCSSIISTRSDKWWYDETMDHGKGFEIFSNGRIKNIATTIEDMEKNHFSTTKVWTNISLSPNQRSSILLNKYSEKVQMYKGIDKKYEADTGKINGTTFNNRLVINGRGRVADKINYQFQGNISSVRIYNKSLTEEEIKANYEIDKERFNITE